MYVKLESDNVSIKAVLAIHKKNKHGEHPIWIRITKDRKPKYISIGCTALIENWNEKERKLWENNPKISAKQKINLTPGEIELLKDAYSKVLIHPDAKTINTKIETEIAKITLLKGKLENTSSESIKESFNTKIEDNKQQNFLAFGRYVADKLLAAGQIRTYKRYDYVLRNMELFIKSPVLKFSALTDDFLSKYENQLKKDGLQTSSIHNYTKTIRAIYYQAVKSKVITDEKNPFKIFQLKPGSSKVKEKLTIEELKKIKNLELEPNSVIWHSRNIFMFSFYMAGIRVGDCLQLKWKDVTKENRLNYQMDKTSENHSLDIVPAAQKILLFYKDLANKEDSFIFPFLGSDLDKTDPTHYYNQITSKTSQVNNNLKKIAGIIGTNKKITFHLTRHTFGDLARKKGTSIYDIQKLFKHSSSKITDIYLKGLDTESQDKTQLDITNDI
jgi:integrase/recombinase XerD